MPLFYCLNREVPAYASQSNDSKFHDQLSSSLILKQIVAFNSMGLPWYFLILQLLCFIEMSPVIPHVQAHHQLLLA